MKNVWFAALACAASALAAPHVASACTRPPPVPSFAGVPANGDTEVPTDVVPYYGFTLGVAPSDMQVPGSFTLTADDGTEIGLTARTSDLWNYELVPDQALEPNTGYTLHGEWPNENGLNPATDQIHFMTGEGPLATPPATPAGRLLHYSLDQTLLTSCSLPAVGTCISVADDNAIILATYIDEFNQEQGTYGFRGSNFGNNLSGQMQGTNFICVELRTRALNGTLSEPLKLCGADFPLQAIHGAGTVVCSADGLSWDMPQSTDPLPADAGAEPVDSGQAQGVGAKPVPTETPVKNAGAAPPTEIPVPAAGAMPASSPSDSVGKPPLSDSSGGCSTAPRASSSALVFSAFGLVAWLGRARRQRRPRART